MARTDYNDAAAEAFQASRELRPDALSEWRAAIARHLAPWPGMPVLDLGAGTGTWATALATWYSISVVAVEPSPAMRGRSRCLRMLGGHATALPLAPATMDGAWLSTVIHHLPDLTAAARFSHVALESVRQVTAPSLAAIAATARRESHTPLMLITDSAYQAGLARLRAAAATQQGPVIDTLDLLVLRARRR